MSDLLCASHPLLAEAWSNVDDAGIAQAHAIISTPGLCSIDFETWPTDPAFHADQAALAAPRGQKATARAKAKRAALRNGRAHRRQPCTLQLAHEDGREVFVRLPGGAAREPRRRELQAMFDGHRATLVAHNAEFECSILLKYGIAVDIYCTLLCAKTLYLEAMPEDQPQPVSFSLAALVEKEFGVVLPKDIRNRDWRLDESITEEAVQYGLNDVRWTLRLFKHYEKILKETEA
jgi:hypothetical protein